MLVGVAYDVNTKTTAGKRRLRRTAKTCESYGQRVQFSGGVWRKFEQDASKAPDVVNRGSPAFRLLHWLGPQWPQTGNQSRSLAWVKANLLQL
jgi:hypothetical protein